MVTYPYACMTYIVSPLAGLGGGHIVPADRLQIVNRSHPLVIAKSHSLHPGVKRMNSHNVGLSSIRNTLVGRLRPLAAPGQTRTTMFFFCNTCNAF